MPKVKLNKIINHLDNYLSHSEFTDDDSWNGLQFEGKTSVKHLATAVDASFDSFTEAVKINADLLIVHHGHFWKQGDPTISNWQQKRLNILFNNSLSLYASHLPLDKHKVVGNNAQILKLLNATIKDDFYKKPHGTIGWTGQIKPTPLADIVKTINSGLSAKSRVLPFGSKVIKSIGVCSGGGSSQGIFEAIQAKVDLYISGDPVYLDVIAKDAGINVILAGHYQTETLGVKALGNHLANKYSIKHTFIDLPPLSNT